MKRRAACLLSLSLVALVWSGCSKKEQSEYVAGISTQVKVPRDLKAVRVSIAVGGVRTICRAYRVYDGKVQLPRSLGSYALNDPKQSGPITFQIIGLSDQLAEGDDLNDLACGDKVGTNGARILRSSRQPYIENEILFLPMPLKYSCFDKNCPDEQTCKGGTCVDATIDPSLLPRFSPELVDGTGANCFSITSCLAAALPAIPVNNDDCTFAVAGTASAPQPQQGAPNPFAAAPPGDGINVEVTYDGGYVREVLDKDPVEGFSIPDPAKPQQFRLAPGLCSLLKGSDTPGKRITAVRASATCQPKTITQPICQGDGFTQMGLDVNGVAPTTPDASCQAYEMFAPKTALAVIIDDTKEHETFFKDDQGLPPDTPPALKSRTKYAVNLAFSDPAFNRADFALMYTSGANKPACTVPTLDFAIQPQRAGQAAPLISTSINDHNAVVAAKTAGTEDPRLEVSLAKAYSTLQGNAAYFRRAVLVISERWTNQCGPVNGAAADLAKKAFDDPNSVETFAFAFTGSDDVDFNQAHFLASQGGSGSAVDARTDTFAAVSGFRNVVNHLGTCVYDDVTDLKDGDKLGYNNPVSGQNVVIDAAPAPCTTGKEATNGWGRGTGTDGKKRIFLCGNACTSYQQTLADAGIVPLAFGKPALAMPMFGYPAACAPKVTP